MHSQLQWNASGAALGEEVFSPLKSKTPLWTWELAVCEEAMAQNSRWEIQEQAGRNIVNDKPGLCFTLGLLVIFRFQPCPENPDLQSCLIYSLFTIKLVYCLGARWIKIKIDKLRKLSSQKQWIRIIQKLWPSLRDSNLEQPKVGVTFPCMQHQNECLY